MVLSELQNLFLSPTTFLGVTFGDTVSVILSFMIGSLSSFLVLGFGFVGVCTNVGSHCNFFVLKINQNWNKVC